MRRFTPLFLSLVASVCFAGAALACHVSGTIVCDGNGTPLEGIRIDLVATDGTVYERYAVSNAEGHYEIALLCEPHCYRITATPLTGQPVVVPASGSYEFCADASNGFVADGRDWRLSSPECQTTTEPGLCWLTAGGVKFSPITGTDLGEAPKLHNWGGNVYPSCSPYPGNGGNWNHLDNGKRLHLKGTDIHVIRCGNIDGIEPGSESPVTGVNFIEFEGTGTLKGIKGNKADYGVVHFWAHCEDRNEPGSNGQNDGVEKDRYFINVFTDPADPVGTSIVLVDLDGNAATMDPITISGGNMQLHDSSCDGSAATYQLSPSEVTGPATSVAFLASPFPNPGSGPRVMRFGLPVSASVSLRIFDAAGRQMRQLENSTMPAGEYRTTWDLRDSNGETVPAGIYFVRLTLGQQVFSRTVTVTP